MGASSSRNIKEALELNESVIATTRNVMEQMPKESFGGKANDALVVCSMSELLTALTQLNRSNIQIRTKLLVFFCDKFVIRENTEPFNSLRAAISSAKSLPSEIRFIARNIFSDCDKSALFSLVSAVVGRIDHADERGDVVVRFLDTESSNAWQWASLDLFQLPTLQDVVHHTQHPYAALFELAASVAETRAELNAVKHRLAECARLGISADDQLADLNAQLDQWKALLAFKLLGIALVLPNIKSAAADVARNLVGSIKVPESSSETRQVAASTSEASDHDQLLRTARDNLLLSGADSSYLTTTFKWPMREIALPPVIVLALDGGGSRGITHPSILQELREKLGMPEETFLGCIQLAGGTSTGSLVAFGLHNGMLLADIAKLYTSLPRAVFGYQFGDGIANIHRSLWRGGWYDVSRLEALLRQHLSADTLPNASAAPKLRVFAVTADALAKPDIVPILLRSYADNTFVELNGIAQWQAARASSAAPLYLEPFAYKTFHLIDGGVIANNPAALVRIEARRLWPHRQICLISIGTGRPANATFGAYRFGAAIKTVVSCITNTAATAALVESDPDPMLFSVRFNPPLRDACLNLDIVDEALLREVETAARNEVKGMPGDKMAQLDSIFKRALGKNDVQSPFTQKFTQASQKWQELLTTALKNAEMEEVAAVQSQAAASSSVSDSKSKSKIIRK